MLELKGSGKKGGNRSQKEQKAWSGQQKKGKELNRWKHEKTLGAAGHAPTAECGHSRLELVCWAQNPKAPRLRSVHESRTPNQSQQTRNPTKTTNTQLTKNNEPTKPTNTQPYKKPATARNQQTQKQNTHQSQQTHKKQQTHNKNNKHTKPTNTKAKHTPKLGFRHCCFRCCLSFFGTYSFFLSWLG